MACNSKLKSLAIQNEISQKDIAKEYNMSYNSFNNKLRSCSTRFNLKDLILYAELTNTKLAFIDENHNPKIIFDMNDLKGNNK